MLLADNVVGNQQDWAQFVSLADEHKTPLLRLIPKGDKPVNRLHQYQADKYDAPAPSNMPEGKDWDTFEAAAANRVELKSRVQRFDKTCAVSVLSQDVTNAAGVKDELAREIRKKTEELSRSIEAALGSDQIAYEDDGVTQDRFQGMGLWVQSGTTNQLYATPSGVRPTASQIYTGTKANLNEDAVRNLLEAQWKATGGTGSMALVVGSQLKRRFSAFTLYVPSDLSTVNGSTANNRNLSDTTLSRVIDRYNSEFGDYELHLSRWLAHPDFSSAAYTSTTKADWRGYGVNLDKWSIRWNTMPNVVKPEFKGGSYKAAMYCILSLCCLNPIGETKIDPSDA
jgi:hypothetical protein